MYVQPCTLEYVQYVIRGTAREYDMYVVVQIWTDAVTGKRIDTRFVECIYIYSWIYGPFGLEAMELARQPLRTLRPGPTDRPHAFRVARTTSRGPLDSALRSAASPLRCLCSRAARALLLINPVGPRWYVRASGIPRSAWSVVLVETGTDCGRVRSQKQHLW